MSVNKETMSSLEIAKLTGKDHDKVMLDIKRVLIEVGIGHATFSDSYLSKQNKELPLYKLPRRECDLVVSGYSAPYRLAIIDRWQELEEKYKPLTRLELAKEQVRLIEVLEAKEAEVKELRIELDESMTWASIKRVEANTGESYSWHHMKKIMEAGERRDVFDSNYGTVKSYSAELWMRAYKINIAEL